MVDINNPKEQTTEDKLYKYAFGWYYGWDRDPDMEEGKSFLNDLYKEGYRPDAPELMYCLGFALYEGIIREKDGRTEGAAWLYEAAKNSGLFDPLHWMAAEALKHIADEEKSPPEAVYLYGHYQMAHNRHGKAAAYYAKAAAQSGLNQQQVGERVQKILDRIERKLTVYISEMDRVSTEFLEKVAGIDAHQTDLEEKINALLDEVQKEYDALKTELPKSIRDQHESELFRLFGEDWRNEKRLCNMTCDRLVAAKVLLHYSEKADLRDYRGVIISATSALEYELYRRFCEGYISYLDASCLSDERKKEIKSVRFGQNFMMGSLMYYLQESDRIGGVDRLRPEDERKLLNGYLSKYVMSEAAFAIKETKNYTHLGHVYVGMRGEKDGIFSMKVKKIKESYRDKAAHKEIIDRVTASECCREIGIGTAETAVQNIEGVLKELLILTKPYVMPQ